MSQRSHPGRGGTREDSKGNLSKTHCNLYINYTLNGTIHKSYKDQTYTWWNNIIREVNVYFT